MVLVSIQSTETKDIQNLVILITVQIRKLRLREGILCLPKVTRGWAPGLGLFVGSASTSGSPWVGQGLEASVGCQFYPGGKLRHRGYSIQCRGDPELKTLCCSPLPLFIKADYDSRYRDRSVSPKLPGPSLSLFLCLCLCLCQSPNLSILNPSSPEEQRAAVTPSNVGLISIA